MKTTFESQLNSIKNVIATMLPEGWEIRNERPAKGAVCKGVLSIFNPTDLWRRKVYENVKASGEAAGKTLPTVMCAFYLGTIDQESIGSVAIYGANASALYMQICRRRTLFGRRIKNVTIEIGRRPFIDVTFAA